MRNESLVSTFEAEGDSNRIYRFLMDNYSRKSLRYMDRSQGESVSALVIPQEEVSFYLLSNIPLLANGARITMSIEPSMVRLTFYPIVFDTKHENPDPSILRASLNPSSSNELEASLSEHQRPSRRTVIRTSGREKIIELFYTQNSLRKKDFVLSRTAEPTLLSIRENEIVNYLSSGGRSRKEIEDYFHMSSRLTLYYLLNLKKKRIIVLEGKKRKSPYSRYYLAKKTF